MSDYIWPYEGQDITDCKWCAVKIYFTETKDNYKVPITYESRTLHRLTCPGQQKVGKPIFKKKKETK